MVENAGSHKIKIVTFEDITEIIKDEPEMRDAIIRLMVSSYPEDVLDQIKTVITPSGKKSVSKKAKKVPSKKKRK